MKAHPKLLRLGRIALGISQQELADAAELGIRSVRNLEAANPDATFRTQEKVQAALERLGIMFLQPDESGRVGFRLPPDDLKK